MSRPLRDLDPSKFRVITIRTNLAQLWMVPSRQLNRMLGGVLARYQEATGIEIFAFCILSNHIHLLVRSANGSLDEFFENVNREIARRVNRLNDRISAFWGRRYDMQTVLTENDLLEAFLYITTNAVRHGLVSEASKWPGLSSYRQSIDEVPQRYKFTHYSLKDDKGNNVVTEHVLKVSRLPLFESLSPKGYRDQVRGLIKQRELRLQEERQETGRGFLGVKGVLRQRRGSVSRETARSRRPSCYTKCAKSRKAYRLQRKWIRCLYFDASRRFRAGDLNVVFPQWCYKPPLHKAPIERPRKVFDDKYALAASRFGYL